MPTIVDAERRLDEFLSSLPTYKRKIFELRTDLTDEEVAQSIADLHVIPGQVDELTQQYMWLLEQIPEKAKWYRKRAKEIYGAFADLMPMPRVPGRGRPRKDTEADEMAQLENSGLSHGQTAMRFNQKYAVEIAAGKMRPVTPGSVSKLISSRYSHANGYTNMDKNTK